MARGRKSFISPSLPLVFRLVTRFGGGEGRGRAAAGAAPLVRSLSRGGSELCDDGTNSLLNAGQAAACTDMGREYEPRLRELVKNSRLLVAFVVYVFRAIANLSYFVSLLPIERTVV